MTITSYLTKLLGKHKRSGRKEQHSFYCPACHYGSNFEINLDEMNKRVTELSVELQTCL